MKPTPKRKTMMRSPRETLERNLARANRRVQRSSTMTNGRQYAIAVDGAVITFECKRAGHHYKIDFASKRRKLNQRISPSATKLYASWWSKEKGGCIGQCPRCEKDTRTPDRDEHGQPMICAMCEGWKYEGKCKCPR